MFGNQSHDFALAAVRRSEILRPTRGWSSGLGLGGRVAHEVAQLVQIAEIYLRQRATILWSAPAD